jgi:hypothetical protein
VGNETAFQKKKTLDGRQLSWISVASRGLDESHHLFKEPVNPEAPELFFRWALVYLNLATHEYNTI